MRLPRLTTRRLMAGVFVVGVVIGGTIEIDRAAIELNRSALQDAMAWERALVVHDAVIRQNLGESTKRGSAELKFV